MTTTTNTPTSSLEAAVDLTRTQHIAAVNAGDVDAALELFSPDGVLLPPAAPALEGTAAIGGWFTQTFSMFRLENFNLKPGGIACFGTIAIEYGRWGATFHPRNGGPSAQGGGTYLTVYAQQPDGTVRMIRDTFNGLPG